MKQEHRKTITFNPLIIKRMEQEIKERGGQTTFSALINEILAEKFNIKKELAEEITK
jgi:uncharacterized FAD-dependent dehydrogenase